MDWYNTFEELEKRNVKELALKIQNILIYEIKENTPFTIKTLEKILKNKNIKYTKEELNIIINIFITNFENIIRIDRWNNNPLYIYLDETKERSNYQRAFYNMQDETTYTNKRFIVISDTHIGNEKIQNFELINNIYNYAEKENIKQIFHLGDVFERVNNVPLEERYKKATKHINQFIKEYPKTVKTIALLGNHDLTIHGNYGTSPLLEENIQEQIYNLKELTKDNPNFYMYARKTFSLELSKIKIHFSHKLYLDLLNQDEKIYSINDISKKELQKVCDHSIYISGHLHRGLLCIGTDQLKNNQFYIGVPSTSNLNIGNAVGYIIELNVESKTKQVNLTTLYAKENNDIFAGETYTHNIDAENKILKKEFGELVGTHK